MLPVQDPYFQQRDRATVLIKQADRRRLWQPVRGPGGVLVDADPLVIDHQVAPGRVHPGHALRRDEPQEVVGHAIDQVGWPQCGEIDVMENFGMDPTVVHGTVHGPGYAGPDGITADCSVICPLHERRFALDTGAPIGHDGPGVAGEDARHVFDRFYRVEGRVASGSGLGLSIARELATVMGGEVTLESAPGRTVVTLALALERVPERDSAAAPVFT